jgi:hypothetical protein
MLLLDKLAIIIFLFNDTVWVKEKGGTYAEV